MTGSLPNRGTGAALTQEQDRTLSAIEFYYHAPRLGWRVHIEELVGRENPTPEELLQWETDSKVLVLAIERGYLTNDQAAQLQLET